MSNVYKIKINNLDEWEEMMKCQNYDISKSIVNKILENLNTKKRFIPILEIEINDNGEIYDITLDRKNMLNTLQVNLKILEKFEDYEGCDSIIKAINIISSKR
jgi:hypothetical protein